MEHEILCGPGYSLVEVKLSPGETLVTEPGAMAWMDPAIEVQTAAKGGVFAGLKRKVLAGESFFQNTYTAPAGGTLALAPGVAGDIVAHPLKGELMLEKGAYLASEPGVTIDSQFQGLRGLFSEGMFVLRATGSGLLFFNAYGDVQVIDVDGEYVVDNGYAVAWEPALQYTFTRARRIRAFLFADQLLLRFSGRGRLWVQSRSPNNLANWVHPFRPVKSSQRN